MVVEGWWTRGQEEGVSQAHTTQVVPLVAQRRSADSRTTEQSQKLDHVVTTWFIL